MRLGVIGACIERERERIESNQLGGFLLYLPCGSCNPENSHILLFSEQRFFFDKSTFWMYEIPSWNINGAGVQMIPMYFRLLYSPLFKFNCRPISFYIWLYKSICQMVSATHNPFSSSFSYYHLNRVERWMNMYERWWWFYMEEQIEKQNRLEEGGTNCQ